MKLTKAQQKLADKLKYDPMIFGSGGYSFFNIEHAVSYARDLQSRVIDSKKRLNYWYENITYSVACEVNYEA